MRPDKQNRAEPEAAFKTNTGKVRPQASYVLSVNVLCLKLGAEGSWPEGQERWNRRVGNRRLLPSAQAVEKGEEYDTDPGGDERIQQKAEREHWHGTGEQHALRDGQHHLMEMEEDEYESKAGDGMLRIDSRAHGGGHVADARFGDAVHADGIVVAERILCDADSSAEKHAAHRIAAAYTEIDRDEQRQID